MSQLRRQYGAKLRIDELISRRAPRFGQCSHAYWRIVTTLRARTQLLSASADSKSAFPDSVKKLLTVCVRLAKQAGDWKRSPEGWIVPDRNPRIQLHSLISHLMDSYPVPQFLLPAWWAPNSEWWQIQLYLHLAKGFSVRQFPTPRLAAFRLSKQAAKWWMKAPDDLSALAAFRWAQVRALGGISLLARSIASCPELEKPTQHEDFWQRVVQFLVANPIVGSEEVRSIVRFVHQQKFVQAAIVWGPDAGQKAVQKAVQPNFSLKGRTLMSLRRHMVHWRSELTSQYSHLTDTNADWVGTGIADYEKRNNDTVWTIRELRKADAIRREGKNMQHCVATYISDCARRGTSIWSMFIVRDGRTMRVATIEVKPVSRRIV